MIFNILAIILGFVLLAKGADALVDGSSSIAKKFNVSQIVIGLTIVAIGTSLPELLITISSSLGGHQDMALGNVIGSNLANILLILGICSILKPLKIDNQTKKYDSVIALLAAIILLVLGNTNKVISRVEGILLLLGAVSFFIFNIKKVKNQKEKNKNKEKISLLKVSILIILGGVALKIGGDLVVDNSVKIAEILGISEKIIGLTILSISTSLPELITCISAIKKNKVDLAIGNILGSQVLNILLILGVSATISPINYSLSYNKDIILLIETSMLFILFPYMGKKNYMTKKNGIFFLATYIIYLVTLILF